MNFISENIVVISLSLSLIFAFLYGRYQYLKGYILGIEEGDKFGITADDYENFGAKERSEGYMVGYKEGLAKGCEVSEGGWQDEATEWRDIIKKVLEKHLEIK